ncbi:MAG: roadblock/LC7 domain-containing protein [Candidatus Thorarchaeota archaeon]|jgi:predicted regulator of Ras-like GTPase activity (Roadblock/LC7/MglB family)
MNHQFSAEGPEKLRAQLKDLSNRSPILGAAVFSIEGLPLVSYFHTGVEDASLAAMVASIYSVSEQALVELKQGAMKAIIIQGDMGTTLVISIPGGYLLCVTAPENAKLGLIFNDAKIVARKISTELQNFL